MVSHQLLNQLTFNQTFIIVLISQLFHVIVVPERIKDMKKRHAQALQLLKLLLKEIPTLGNEELRNLRFNLIIYDAIKNGLVEFIQELIKSNPELVWRVDNKGRTLFAYAILLRQEKIFSLIYGLGAKRRTIVTKRDVFSNNFLHMAAKLSPSFQLDRVPGAALQMQKELQWFKVIFIFKIFLLDFKFIN